MQPSGTVGLVGFATSALFLRDALDKAGIEAQFAARGEYNSAANLFTQDRHTDAHREADSRLLDSLHGQVWQAVADSRHIAPDAVDELANKAKVLAGHDEDDDVRIVSFPARRSWTSCDPSRHPSRPPRRCRKRSRAA